MSRIAILVPELAGHLLPAGELGRELQRRGHQVTLVSRSKAADLARQLDLPLRELSDEGVASPASLSSQTAGCPAARHRLDCGGRNPLVPEGGTGPAPGARHPEGVTGRVRPGRSGYPGGRHGR